MKYLFIFFLSFFIIKNTATAQSNFGTLEGKLTDKETGEGLIFASIVVYKTGETTPIAGNSTDINGHFSINNIPVGVYDVEFNYVGYKPTLVRRIEINAGAEMMIVGSLEENTTVSHCDGIILYSTVLIGQGDFGTGRVYTAGDIQNMPAKW